MVGLLWCSVNEKIWLPTSLRTGTLFFSLFVTDTWYLTDREYLHFYHAHCTRSGRRLDFGSQRKFEQKLMYIINFGEKSFILRKLNTDMHTSSDTICPAIFCHYCHVSLLKWVGNSQNEPSFIPKKIKKWAIFYCLKNHPFFIQQFVEQWSWDV